MLARAADNILDHFLCAPPGRPVTVVYPGEKAAVARTLADGLRERGAPPRLVAVPEEAESLPEEALAAFQDAGCGLVVLMSHRMWARQGMQAFFLMRGGAPGLDVRCSPVFLDTVIAPESFLRIYASDPGQDRAFLAGLQASLPASRAVRVTAPGGTDLCFRSRHWQACGTTEVLTAPVEGSAEGRIVADLSLFCGLVATPVELVVRDGRLVDMRCDDGSDRLFRMYRAEMEHRFAETEANRVLAEVGVGGNGGARPSGVLMEDEAVRGTCHFCFGDNCRYGGANCSDWHGGTASWVGERRDR